ncbi:hypothetical protein QBC35DRAFT_507414 [Podospora australis]|uniref:F-box domain-containing protein n=1 Tax=Podospora australis TaxID=1536484 RepID=A0AAN6WLY7_9PEZI|nr:hypothetical protein QBC35DRAFT_507414 [Podospora australis]
MASSCDPAIGAAAATTTAGLGAHELQAAFQQVTRLPAHHLSRQEQQQTDGDTISPLPPAVIRSSGNGGPGGRNIIHGLMGSGETVRNTITAFAAARSNSNTIVTCKAPRNLNEIKEDEVGDDGILADIQPPRPKQTSPFLTKLPPEVLQAIIRRCRFADIVNLRKTCKTLHLLASPREMRILHGSHQFRQLLRCHCRVCLTHNEDRRKLLKTGGPGYPLSNKCIDCALKEEDPRVKVGRKVELANFSSVWVCRWCGRPVAEHPAVSSEQFHRRCYSRYNRALGIFFILGWLQFCFGIIGGALAWRYFRWDRLVFGPTVTNFLLLWIVLGLVIFRGNRVRTYNIAFCLELVILGLWIAPVYHVSKLVRDDLDTGVVPVAKSTWAALVIFGLNMFFRFMNVVGNFILLFRPDLTRRRRPAVSLWKRGLYKIACLFIFFTYPQSLESKVQ